MHNKLQELNRQLTGQLLTDAVSRTIYATDASLYFDTPLAVAVPANEADLEHLIRFAAQNKITLIPRAAGTSLGGQATGPGIVVDLSKHFGQIIELNIQQRWVRVQPGVVRDQLNQFLAAHGMMFCPETSTSNRCMIGGMIGNNSCGEHSLIYGSTRDHLISVRCYLSDTSQAEFGPLTQQQFHEKCLGHTLENQIYRSIHHTLSRTGMAQEIDANYPEAIIKRRNNGYALDALLHSHVFDPTSHRPFNMAQFICGSEGTLAFIAEAKLNIIPIPTEKNLFVCAHFATLQQALLANLVALSHEPTAVELIDKTIVQGAAQNLSQQQNCFFIQGQPQAILIIELANNDATQLLHQANQLIAHLQTDGLGYHFPIIEGNAMTQVRNLRKAGLGILTSVTTLLKPHSFVEDTAVSPHKLPAYIAEFHQMLQSHGVDCAYYGHISTGELHFKPILNLRTQHGVELLNKIAYQTALLVKKYRGSLSGEHGDGRIRAQFIPLMLGETIYQSLVDIKQVFDPQNIFNAGKIIAPPPIALNLREQRLIDEPNFKTFFDYSNTNGLLRAIERCNGTADCRKSSAIGGVMCPSFMATHNENTTTRARANLLRELLYDKSHNNPFARKELHDILDLCLMCKGCKTECPSGIDMARYKAEFLQHYHDAHGVSMRSWLVANITRINRVGMLWPTAFNYFARARFSSNMLKRLLKFAPQRTIPALSKTTLTKWATAYLKQNNSQGKTLYFFADEFINYNDVEIGRKAIQLLIKLGYCVKLAPIANSGRTYFSKGWVKKAKALAMHNVNQLSALATPETPLVGIEPSAILSFRDEYPDIVGNQLQPTAQAIAKCAFTIEEFLATEFTLGHIDAKAFTTTSATIKLHGHCHQKALSTTLPTKQMLEIPQNYQVDEIPSGCCGMAGSFGFEKEHYNLSMQIGEMVLFPAIRKAKNEIIAAPGISCRQQIQNGTGIKAWHPVEILFDSLV
ncbi:MAG: FAD-linked oxidase C-terminal domain-containing protein [Bacteroidota bacterium]